MARFLANAYDTEEKALLFEVIFRDNAYAPEADHSHGQAAQAQRDGQAVIVDAKTGQDSASHVVQVMIYLYAIPRALERYQTLKLRGQATYLDHTVRVPTEAVDDQFIQNLGTLIRGLSADKPPARVPSRQECRFCDITAEDCADRVEDETHPQESTTTDF